MKHLFIVNPTAGGHDRSADVTAAVRKAFEAIEDPDYEIYVTKAPMDAAAKIKTEAAKTEELRVYSCGGDGTFNECICGAVGLPHVAVCPYSSGTGNDFCRMFGDEAALFTDIPAMISGTVRPIDVIDCNGRSSVNICCAGIDARIGADVHKYSKIPVIGGATGYVVSLLVNVFAGINRNMTVRCGDYIASGKHALVSVCNGRYYGGGFNPSLTARPDDGELDIFIVEGISLLKLVTLIGKYSSGRSDEIKTHIKHIKGTEIEIDFDEESVINLDGEVIYAKSAKMKLIPGAVNLIVPRGVHFFES